MLGAFSSRFIQRRFKSESEKQALANVDAAVSAINHAIRSEAESFSGSQYLIDILNGRTDARIRDVATDGASTRFTLFDRQANLLLDEGLSDFSRSENEFLLEEKNIGKITLTFDYPNLYGGVVVPVSLPGGPSGYLYYRRVLDDGFVKGIAEVLGGNINVYYRGYLRASSERDLFVGGFLNPLLSATVFADVALSNSRKVVREESVGDYFYQVASSPITTLLGPESGVLSVPMLYQPILVQREIKKTSALILGLLALLFAATITLGVFLAGKIFTPIAALSGGTRRIIEGDLEFRLEAEAPDEIGELVASFNTMTSALSKARHDLLERQRYLTAVLDNVATGVMTVDSEGRIITLNPSGEKILHVSRTDIIGRPAGEVDEGVLRPLLDLLQAAEQRTVEREINIVIGDERRTLKAVVTSLHEDGRRLGTVAVFDDLTELIRSNKLSAWIEMARQIAHEVKNPLTPIRLSAQLMRRAYEEGSDEFGEIFRSGVQTVIQQTDILRRIASEFSSFGKATNLRPELVALAEFIDDFIPSYRGAENVELHVTAGEDVTVLADREALRKILVNLVENALEAMPDGGEITFGLRRRENTAEITVTDTGTGLPPEVRDRLFEPYFSTKTNGTGLGLAICQSLAREMDGEIHLRNREHGNGVEAIVVFPAIG
jgi:two-component system nitrogen regulation sensor histidine kinase NtrY